ncbi:MAG: DUF465 domain-containing protein [Methylobacteriaceae bacterium]|nr:DUF465 domain-containing protein [Methylobacteriaceae bacterium]
MSVDAHLAELLRRHQALDKEIASESAHASVDELRLTELKRKKLMLKDKIERLKHEPTVH